MFRRRLLGHRILTTLVVLLTATLVMSLSGVTDLASASPGAAAHPAAPSAFAQAASAPTEGAKVTLGETSIDSPALWTSDTGGVRALLAWTGTDSAHHLNLLSSADGVSWGSKVTLAETSRFRAGLARTGPNASDRAVVAWTGTDANQSLNVLVGTPPSSSIKLTLSQENSFTGPSIAVFKGDLYLAWAGTDAAHTLNVDRISIGASTLSVQQKTILWGWGSPATPTIAFDATGNRLVMSWIDASQHVSFAFSTNGANWTQPAQSPLTESSGASPALLSALATNVSSNLARYFLAWTGTDAAHSVNVKFTTSFPYWPRSYDKATLAEQAFGAPVLGSVGVSASLLLAWTGTDAAHHLNVAKVAAPYAAACVPAAGVQPTIPTTISHGVTTATEVSLTFDSDGGSAGNAAAYLDILKAHQIHATFFLTGQFAQVNPAIVQRIVSDGHDIGNHTMDHPDLANPARTDTFMCNELTSADSIIASSAGQATRPYFRPPYGSYNEQTQYLAAALGYRTILWNIDPRDWDSNTSAQNIIGSVLNSPNLGPGAIILMHVNSAHEAEALGSVITGLQQRGYTIVPLSQLLR